MRSLCFDFLFIFLNFSFCLMALVGGSAGCFCGVSSKRLCVVCLLGFVLNTDIR